jgi:bacterioferritin
VSPAVVAACRKSLMALRAAEWPGVGSSSPRSSAMKGDPDVLKRLNQILTNELTSINQYFLHARMYQNEGYGKLGKKTYEESIEEMKHADRLVKRILLLDGLPNLQNLGKLQIGEGVKERLGADLAAETRGRTAIVETILLCEQKQDYVSRDLLTEILDDTEEHIDFLETQLNVLEQIGMQNYLQSQYDLESDASA